MQNSKFYELNDVKEWLEHQIYVRGLDNDELFNLMKTWFENDYLKSMLLKRLNIDEDSNNQEIEAKIDFLDSALDELQEIFRTHLSEYTDELEESREKAKNFVVGFGMSQYVNNALNK